MFVLFGPVRKTKGVLNRVLVGRNWLKYTDKVGSVVGSKIVVVGVMRRSIRKFNIPPPGNPPGI